MRSEPQGPGWWMASDAQWYPPELHPSVLSGATTVAELRTQPLLSHHRTRIQWASEPQPSEPQPSEPQPQDTVDPVQLEAATRVEAAAQPEVRETVVVPAAARASRAGVVVGAPPTTPPWRSPNGNGIEVDDGIDAEHRAMIDALRNPSVAPRGADSSPRIRATATDGNTETDEIFPPERPSTILLVGVAVAALALIAISAFTFIRNRDDDPFEPTPLTVPAGEDATATDDESAPVGAAVLSADDLEVGNCLSGPQISSGRLRDATTIDCAEAHTYEVYASVEYSGTEETLDPSAVAQFAESECQMAFEGFIGRPFAESAYFYVALGPTPEGWTAGDRTVACLVFANGDPVTGSLSGIDA